ncbi:hypothetical protein HDV02_006569, partial [Globomyces sp. JEL0801]
FTLITSIAKNRLETYCGQNKALYEGSFGFRKKMGNSAAIAFLIDISSRRRVALGATFIGLRKAVDTMSIRALIFLKQYGLCGRMLNFVENLYGTSSAVVRCGEYISDSFE